MSLPTGLFVDAPEMQDPSLTQISNQPEEWPEEIVSKVKERVPQSNSMSIIVKFMKQDEENGTATGSAIIGNATKQVVIPVIIKDFMMSPLDVMVADSRLLPLTPDYFAAVFSDNAMFQKMEEYPTFGGLGRFEDANLWNATYPPSLGRYAYAAGDFPLLQAIADTMTEADLNEFKKQALDPSCVVGFHRNGHLDSIKKFANLRPVNMNEFRQGADNLIKKDIFMLRKEGPNKYTILSNAYNTYSPTISPILNKDRLYEMVSKISDKVQDDVNDVDQNGEKMIVTYQPEEQMGAPYLEHEMIDKATLVEANEFDHYVVKDKAGMEHLGMVIPNVINFDMQKVPLKIFAGKVMSTIQKDIGGVRVKNSHWHMKDSPYQVGQTGTFYWQPKDNPAKCLATIPVTIKSVMSSEGGSQDSVSLTVVTLSGVSMKLKFSCGCELKRIAHMGDNEYLMPEGFKWYPMEGFKEVSHSPEDYAMKTAGQKTANPVKIISTGYGQYSLTGVEKYAELAGWDQTNMHEHQVKFLLASLGANNEKIAHFIKQANRSGCAIVHNLRRPPTKQEKVAAAMPKAQKLLKVAKDLKANLIKEASFIENSQTVDSLLSLNFVNPENVAKFVGKIPQLKSAISGLASLLIASRIGMKEIPEQAASTAMYRLIDVVNGLEALRSTQETH